MNPGFRILTYMEPVERPRGRGFKTLVSPQEGYYVVVSEVHIETEGGTSTEALCFPADRDGTIRSMTDLGAGWNTPDAINGLREWWTPSLHERASRAD